MIKDLWHKLLPPMWLIVALGGYFIGFGTALVTFWLMYEFEYIWICILWGFAIGAGYIVATYILISARGV